MKHKNTQPLYIFNRENPQNSEPQNGPRSGLDYIALDFFAFGCEHMLGPLKIDVIYESPFSSFYSLSCAPRHSAQFCWSLG